MCGIAGFSGQFSPEALHLASLAISHRGPDDSGMFFDGHRVGLAHRRLSIIDLSPLGKQPMATPDGAVVIVFNGEIYNYRELRSELAKQNVKFRSHSDTEVLLHLYLLHGEAMLNRLNGIFAFALWDRQDRSLFIARDAQGVKPLYYASTPQGVAFASEVKSLLHLVPHERNLDALAVHRYLTFLWCPGDQTPLRSVRKLPPGAALRVQNGSVTRQWTWYDIPRGGMKGRSVPTNWAVAQTVRSLSGAVQRQLVADVPVGSFLSGGLDSSAVVTFAREVVPDIQCFTIELTGKQDRGFVDDLPYARRVADHLNVPLEVVTVDANRMSDDFEQMIRQLDEPLADPAPLNVLYICQLARRNGIKVLLSGLGGDDLFSGYRRHLALRYDSFWRWLPRTLRSGVARSVRRLDQRRALIRRLSKFMEGSDLQGDARLVQYFRWIGESDLTHLYTDSFRSAIGDEPAEQPMLDYLTKIPEDNDRLNRLLALEQRFFLADHNLIYTDKMSMAASVEVRVPFLDPELVALAAQLPQHLKQRGATGKWILKRAMEPFLPNDVIHRPKVGFGAPLRHWMRGELMPLLSDLLSRESLSRHGIFEPKAIDHLLRQNARGEVDVSYTLFAVMSVVIWCRTFIDGRFGPDPPEHRHTRPIEAAGESASVDSLLAS